MRLCRMMMLAAFATMIGLGAQGQAAPSSGPVVVTDFTNPAVSPSHWTLTLLPDGNGHFHSERGSLPATETTGMDAPNVDRDFEVSKDFAENVFKEARGHRLFNFDCESHLKVAFQGWKKLSYVGPEGHGSCTFSYSKDKEIQQLGDSLVGLAETLLEGARLEVLLQHDRLGLDREMEFITDAAKDGRLKEICAIKGILETLEADPTVLDRVRKRARLLIAAGER
jgi:hypothetical protein